MPYLVFLYQGVLDGWCSSLQQVCPRLDCCDLQKEKNRLSFLNQEMQQSAPYTFEAPFLPPLLHPHCIFPWKHFSLDGSVEEKRTKPPGHHCALPKLRCLAKVCCYTPWRATTANGSPQKAGSNLSSMGMCSTTTLTAPEESNFTYNLVLSAWYERE